MRRFVKSRLGRVDEAQVNPHRLTAARGQGGFTLIELLVVILIIAVLAAIAIPSFLSQRSKAFDAAAKETARSAALAAETYSTDHSANYEGLTPKVLKEYEPVLQIEEGNNNAYLSKAEATEKGAGYVVSAVAPSSGDVFTVTKKEGGEVVRTCKAEGANTSGCRTGKW